MTTPRPKHQPLLQSLFALYTEQGNLYCVYKSVQEATDDAAQSRITGRYVIKEYRLKP